MIIRTFISDKNRYFFDRKGIMADWKARLGILYSTDPNYEYQYDEIVEPETLSPERQPLRVSISRRHRAGKEVSVVTGFVGSTSDLEALGKTLRQRCGVGGSAKDGEILIQGDQRDRLLAILHDLGYTSVRRSG